MTLATTAILANNPLRKNRVAIPANVIWRTQLGRTAKMSERSAPKGT